MALTNIARFVLSDEELSEVNTAMETLYRILTPRTISLTPEIRRELLKMGDKTFAFVEKAMELANQNPDFIPAYVDLNEANIDFQAFKLLRMINRKIEALSQLLEDTQIQSGSEVYTVTLSVYDQIKAIAKAVGSVESQKAKEELSTRFPGNLAKKKESEPLSA